MVLDEDAKFGDWIFDTFETLFQSFEHAAEAVVLDQEQELFFRFAVVIQTRETDIRLTRKSAHRRRVIILLGEDPRCGAKNEFQFLIVFRHQFFDISFLATDDTDFFDLQSYVFEFEWLTFDSCGWWCNS